jgi:hypothetical protein
MGNSVMTQQPLRYYLNSEDVTDDLIMKRCKSLGNAVRLCRDCSPLTDKEIIDAISERTGYEYQLSHFSEALNGGKKNFAPDHIPVLEDVCSNWIPTRYMALSRNCELKRKKEALEIELDAVRTERDELQKRYDITIEAFKAVKA